MPGTSRVLPPDATTRSVHAGFGDVGDWLARGQAVVSPVTRLGYRVGRLLGRGGFGQVYLVRRAGASRTVPAVLCLKVSPHMDGWVREAYFGQILSEHPRAIRIYDAFPFWQGTRPPLSAWRSSTPATAI